MAKAKKGKRKAKAVEPAPAPEPTGEPTAPRKAPRKPPGRLMGPKQREALSAEAIGANLFSELLLAYAALKLEEKHEEAVEVGLKLLPYVKPKLRSHQHEVKEEVVIRFTVGGE